MGLDIVTSNVFEMGISRHWLPANIVVITTQGDMSPAAIDLWAQTVIDTIKSYPPALPAIFLMHDLSHPNQRITPYARQRAQEIHYQIPLNRPLYAAVVMQNTFATQLASVIIRIWNRSQPNMQHGLFHRLAEGEAWLHTMAARHGLSSA